MNFKLHFFEYNIFLAKTGHIISLYLEQRYHNSQLFVKISRIIHIRDFEYLDQFLNILIHCYLTPYTNRYKQTDETD